MRVMSSAFTDGRPIEKRHAATEQTEGISPDVRWEELPEGTRSIAVTVIDRHPVARGFVHWAVVDIPPEATTIPEGASGSGFGRELVNTAGRRGWHGPKPPPGGGAHPYELTVRALSAPHVDVPDQPEARDLERAFAGTTLDSQAVTATYER